MSGSLLPVLNSPPQASHVYGGAGQPRQRQVFLVRFRPGADVVGTLNNMTYVVKHCDRPKIQPKAEELNQYNKKRVIYTGFKYEPIRMTFYDSADGAAQNMWAQYSQYYFSDFAKSANIGYGYDITTPSLLGMSAYGISQEYNGGNDNASQWFFDHIEIYHFYVSGNTRKYDSYFLYNPRISAFEPDELDYEQSNVSQINMTIVYENLQYNPAQSFDAGSFEEFANGNFNGFPLDEAPYASSTTPTGTGSTNYNNSTNPDLSSLLGGATAAIAGSSAYRYISQTVTGALSMFGNYSFGGASLPTLANQAINGSVLNNISSTVGATASQFGAAGNNITSALLGTGGSLLNNGSGTILPSAALATLNAGSGGTAQYGFNNGNVAGINPATYAQALQNSSSTIDSVSQWF